MLLLDDEDELPAFPQEEEQALAFELGIYGLSKIDEAIVNNTKANWSKVARVISEAITAGGLNYSEATINLHTRRVMLLVESGALESQGNLKKPRFSEVRISNV
ncbi:MAG: hypothetical protein IPN42_04625 [Methylococcaceae bacterium]|nr:hypothetical protein [Methylococcaceae bacterium]